MNLYSKDFLFPAGNLRDEKRSSERADIIIVTKCNSNLNKIGKEEILHQLRPKSDQRVFFTSIHYGLPYHLSSRKEFDLQPDTDVLLVCGIANPKSLETEVLSKCASVKMLQFHDHHVYDSFDLKKILEQFSKIKSSKKIIITTEKDAVRLSAFQQELKHLPVFVLPMSHKFLFDEEKKFERLILNFIKSFAQHPK